jgi:hypothetical protein
MRRVSLMVASVAIIAALTGGLPAAATTGPDKPALPLPTAANPAKPTRDVSTLAANGYFYVWDGANRAGRWCAWYQGRDDDPWWGDTPSRPTGSGNCNDMATSLWNNAGLGHDVYIYKNINYGSPGALVCAGEYQENLGGKVWSDGSTANNSISSHFWYDSSYC